MANNVVGVFDDVNQVEAAIKQLHAADVSEDAISMVSTSITGNETVHGVAHEGKQTGRGAKTGAGWGAATGGIFGLLLGSAMIWIPGIGPIIALGPLAGGLSGALSGAGGGAVVGALVGHGIPKDVATSYEHQIKQGKYLLVVSVDAAQVPRVEEVLRGSGAKEMQAH